MHQDKEKKRQIIKDWNDAFPLLKFRPTTRLLMRLDALVVGIRIEPGKYDGNEYDPILVYYSLWNEDCQRTLFIQYFEDVPRIKYTEHNAFFQSALGKVKELCGGLFNEEVTLSDLFRILKTKYQLKYRPYLFERVAICEILLALATIFNDDKVLFSAVKHRVKQDMAEWGMNHFKVLYGKQPDEWFEEITMHFSNHDAFIERINKNSQVPKVAGLREGHIINDGDEAIKALKEIKRPLKYKIKDLWKNISFRR